jgi:hypothetical protein
MIAAVLAILKGLLGFGGSIATAIAEAKIAASNAATEQERIAAAERAARLEVQARAHNAVTAIVQVGFALPYIIWLWKAVPYDKVWMGGTTATDGLGGALEYGFLVVIGFYFLTYTVGRLRQ